jgi:hypothetical protein
MVVGSVWRLSTGFQARPHHGHELRPVLEEGLAEDDNAPEEPAYRQRGFRA